MTNAEARCNKSLRPRKPEGSLGRTAQDGHLDSHTAPELCTLCEQGMYFMKASEDRLPDNRFWLTDMPRAAAVVAAPMRKLCAPICYQIIFFKQSTKIVFILYRNEHI